MEGERNRPGAVETMTQLIVDAEVATRPCPTCGAPPAEATPAIASRRRAEDLDWDELKGYLDHFFKEKVFYSYGRCGRCGLLYCPRYFTRATMDAVYAQAQHVMEGVPLDALRRTQDGYLRALRRHSPLRGDYLEIGPDIGLLAEACARAGEFGRLWLYEPSRVAQEELRRRLAGRDVAIRDETDAFDAVPERSVAVAAMVHVLDHLLDPRDTLVKLRSRLLPGARLLVVTHDESSALARVLGGRWPPYCLAHPQLYRRSSLGRALESAGFRVLQTRKTTNRFPVTYLARHLLSAAGLRGVPLPSWERLQVSLRLGNILAVAEPA